MLRTRAETTVIGVMGQDGRVYFEHQSIPKVGVSLMEWMWVSLSLVVVAAVSVAAYLI